MCFFHELWLVDTVPSQATAQYTQDPRDIPKMRKKKRIVCTREYGEIRDGNIHLNTYDNNVFKHHSESLHLSIAKFQQGD